MKILSFIKKYILFLIILLLLAGLLIVLLRSKNLSSVDKFAMCLSENKVAMYGVDYCKSCQNQKNMFADSFKYIKYINCDFNRDTCQDLGITGYPVWIINDKKYSGVKSFNQLEQLSGCGIKNL